MKQRTKHTPNMRTFFNRYHHYLLTGLCLLLIAASMVITGCAINGSEDNSEPERPAVTSDDIVNLPFFVWAKNGDKIDPETTDADMSLIAELGREPVMAPDGDQVTWSDWSSMTGSISVECTDGGTYAQLVLSGLISHGVYTVWNVTFTEPGFTGEFAKASISRKCKDGWPGPSDGSRSMFLASASGEGSIIFTTPAGELGMLGEIGGCALTDEMEWHEVGLYHSDRKTYGPERGPEGTHAEQFAFVFKQAES